MQPPEPSPQTPESRLAAAKAARGRAFGQTGERDACSRHCRSSGAGQGAPACRPDADDLRETRGETREAERHSRRHGERSVGTCGGCRRERADGRGGDGLVRSGRRSCRFGVGRRGRGSFLGGRSPGCPGCGRRRARLVRRRPRKGEEDQGRRCSRATVALCRCARCRHERKRVPLLEANRAVASETELRLQQMRAGIMEVKAPGFDRPTESVPAPSAAAGASPLEYAAVSDEAPAAPYGEALAGQTCAMPPQRGRPAGRELLCAASHRTAGVLAGTGRAQQGVVGSAGCRPQRLF